MNDLQLMTMDEVHAFGIDIVVQYLVEQGYTIQSVNCYRGSDPSNPEIIASKDGILHFIAVRTACYPYHGTLESQEILDKLVAHADANGARPHFASVGIANADAHDDVQRAMPIRGAGFYVAFHGLVELNRGFRLPAPQPLSSFNADGVIAGQVRVRPDGCHVLDFEQSSDFNCGLFSIFLVHSGGLSEAQRLVFSSWAGLPTTAWTQIHRQWFALSIMHHFLDIKAARTPAPAELMAIASHLSPQRLPPPPRPLTNEIRELFNSLYVSASGRGA